MSDKDKKYIITYMQNPKKKKEKGMDTTKQKQIHRYKNKLVEKEEGWASEEKVIKRHKLVRIK